MQTLTLIRGIPGSGKTTLARMICYATNNLKWGNPNCFYYEADMYMIDSYGNYCFDRGKLNHCHDTCFENAIETLKDGYSVIVSNTFIKKWEMQRYVDAANELNITVNEIVLRGGFKSIHLVPEEIIQRMSEEFEV